MQVWYRVIQIVINRDDVQGYAAKTVFEVSFYKLMLQCDWRFLSVTGDDEMLMMSTVVLYFEYSVQ